MLINQRVMCSASVQLLGGSAVSARLSARGPGLRLLPRERRRLPSAALVLSGEGESPAALVLSGEGESPVALVLSEKGESPAALVLSGKGESPHLPLWFCQKKVSHLPLW